MSVLIPVSMLLGLAIAFSVALVCEHLPHPNDCGGFQ